MGDSSLSFVLFGVFQIGGVDEAQEKQQHCANRALCSLLAGRTTPHPCQSSLGLRTLKEDEGGQGPGPGQGKTGWKCWCSGVKRKGLGDPECSHPVTGKGCERLQRQTRTTAQVLHPDRPHTFNQPVAGSMSQGLRLHINSWILSWRMFVDLMCHALSPADNFDWFSLRFG